MILTYALSPSKWLRMKKIFLVANVQFTLTQFRSELIDLLRERGHKVVLVCPNTTGNLHAEPDQNVIEYKLSRGGINPFRDFQTFLSLARLFGREKPDIILNFTIKPIIYSSLAARLFSPKTKVFSNITGLGYIFTDNSLGTRVLRLLIVFLYRCALRFNQSVFFQNPDDEMLFKNLGLVSQAQAVRLNGSGINLERITRSSKSKEEQSFIFVGRLLRDKGLGELIEAVEKLSLRYPLMKCYIVGGNDDNPNSFTSQDIEKFSKNKALVFLGHRKDIVELLRSASVFVLPSYREGTPRSTLEAMAVGLPIITTNVPGCRETVIDQYNGFIVPVKNSEVLYTKMKFFLENPDQIKIMGNHSRDYVEKKFDVKEVNLKILNVIGG